MALANRPFPPFRRELLRVALRSAIVISLRVCPLSLHLAGRFPLVLWSEEYERRAAAMRHRNESDRLASRLGQEHLRIAEVTAATGAIKRHYTVPSKN